MSRLHQVPLLLSRRALLGSAGALTLAPRVALALEKGPVASARRPTLVVVFLRGGADGLNLIVPHGESAYYDLRPSLAIPRPGSEGGALDLDGFFGLHPAAAALLPFFEDGTALALPAVGHAQNTRSHFEEQDVWETAVEGSAASTAGWLNRHLATSRGRGPVRAIALGSSLPRSLRGEAQAMALRGLDDLSFPGATDGFARTLSALDRAYAAPASAPGALQRGGRASLDALSQLQAVARMPHSTKVEYPETDFGRRARELARLIRADVGLEVGCLDLDGWDTHQNQGAATGPHAERVRTLAEGLAALARDLDQRLDDVLVVCVTEFGRTARENGTGGSDHGWASCALALGGALKRTDRDRRVVGAWPGLAPEALNQARDLAHTTDFRDLYAELAGFLGRSDLAAVLPGFTPRPIGLL